MALCVPNQTGMLHLIPIQSTFAQDSEEKNQPFNWRIHLGPNSFVFMQFSAKILGWPTPRSWCSSGKCWVRH